MVLDNETIKTICLFLYLFSFFIISIIRDIKIIFELMILQISLGSFSMFSVIFLDADTNTAVEGLIYIFLFLNIVTIFSTDKKIHSSYKE